MVSSLSLTNFSQKLLQPSSMAISGSVAIHVILGFALPSLSLLKPKTEQSNQKTVRLVQLTPFEQSRLPDLSPSSSTPIPSFPNTSLSDYPLANNPLLPKISDLPPLADSSFLLPSLSSSSNNQNALNNQKINEILGNSANIVPPPPRPNLPTSNVVNIPFSYQQNALLPPPPSGQQQSIASNNIPRQIPSGLASQPDYGTFTPNPNANINQLLPQNQNYNPNQVPNNDSNRRVPVFNYPVTVNPETIPQQNGQTTAANSLWRQNHELLMADIRNRQASLNQDASNTTNEEARKNYVDWINTVKAIKPETVAITGTYPKDACVKRLESSAVYGVVVSSAGAVSDIRLLKSSGYPILNQQAIADIKSHKFSNNLGASKPYQVEVNFPYNKNICPSLFTPINESQATPAKPITPVIPQEARRETSTPTETKPETPAIPQEARRETPTPTENKPETPSIPQEARRETATPTENKPETPSIPQEARRETPTPTENKPETPSIPQEARRETATPTLNKPETPVIPQETTVTPDQPTELPEKVSTEASDLK